MTDTATETTTFTVGQVLASGRDMPIGAQFTGIATGARYERRQDGEIYRLTAGAGAIGDHMTGGFSRTGGYRIDALEIAPEPTTPTFVVGQRVPSPEVLPVGTQFVSLTTQATFERRSDNRFYRTSSYGGERAGAQYIDGWATATGYRITHLPGTFQVGEVVRDRQVFSDLPIGSQIQDNDGNGTTLTKLTVDQWRSDRGRTTFTRDLSLDYNVLRRVGPEPSPAPQVQVIERLPEADGEMAKGTAFSLDEYKALFYTVVMQRVFANGQGTYLSATRDALPTIDVAVPTTENLRHVGIYDGTITSLIGNKLLEIGSPGSKRYTVYAHQSGAWVRLIGDRGIEHWTFARVIGAPESVPEISAVEDFKDQAWQLGRRIKDQRDWCSQVEMAFRQAGILNSQGRRMDRPMTPDQVAARPEGEMFYAVGLGNAVALRRDNSSTNPARTVRVGGGLPGSWAPAMHPITVPPSCWWIGPEGCDSLPVGSILENETNGAQYTKTEDRWLPGDSRYSARDLMGHTSRIIRFGN